MSKKKKVFRNILIIIGVFIVAAFSVNWLLTKRLEGFLKRELSIRTAKATDNFYDLSFDNLSISFFKGELRIEGIHLKPDSVTFNDWLQKDSLPDTYFIAHIGDIDFKGLNLTWRHNYKHLYFDTFAIKKPIIEVITPFSAYQDTTNSSSQKKRSENVKSKTLYEVISPYINILSVNAIALDSASAFFTVESNASPLVYGLENVSFNAYGFLLNEFSSDDGKLLYSDNFEFITNQPQVLFSNQDFKLETQQILLSTIDSVIRISDIHFYPEDKLWDNLKEKPEKSLNAFIADVEFDGIHFWRKNGLNHLAVRSFEIIKPDINITNLSGGKKKSDKIVRGDPFTNDSLVQNISLYTMISPVLNSVSIQEVAIEEAKMNYDWLSGDSINQFQLNDFNLQAQQFHVDSLSEISHNFFYSKNFMMRAHDISLLMKHENQKMKIDRIFLDSDEGDLLFSGISVIPLSTIKPGIYVSGAIDTLGFLGVNYDKGITMRSIKLEKPDIQLLLSGSKPSKSDKTARQKSSMSVSVGEILNPMFRFIQIHDIEIDQISLTIDDRISTVPAKYQLDKFDFFVTDFIINSQTVQHEPFFFDYKNIGFRFSDFDNLILNNSYRLRIANAEFSTLKGMLEFNQINFETVTTDLKSTLNFTTPYLQFKGLNNLPEYPIKNLQFSNFLIQSPCLNYQEITGLKLDLKLNEFSVDSFLWGSESLNLGTINLRYPVVAFTAAKPKFNDDPKNETKKENPDAVYLALKRIADQIDLRQLSLTDASVAFDYYNKKYELNSFSFSPINFSLQNLNVDNVNKQFNLGSLNYSMHNIAYPFNDGFYKFTIGSLYLTENSIRLDTVQLTSPYSKMEFAYKQPEHKDWFQFSVSNVSLTGIDVPRYLKDKFIQVDQLYVNDALLQNFKNKKIPVPMHEVAPIYNLLKENKLNYHINQGLINNFTVIYEELEKKAEEPGRFEISDMIGRFSDFTNVASHPDQYIVVDASGRMMGKCPFTGVWKIPINSPTDRFYLSGHIQNFDMTDINPLIYPMTSAKVKSGVVKDMTFDAVADNEGGSVKMLFLYNDLYVELMKEHDGKPEERSFLDKLINSILKHNNPSIGRDGKPKEPRSGDLTFVRNPYHSSFNYFWQILRPALEQSVGVSKKLQDEMAEASGFLAKLKNFFKRKKTNENKKQNEEEEEDGFILQVAPSVSTQ